MARTNSVTVVAALTTTGQVVAAPKSSHRSVIISADGAWKFGSVTGDADFLVPADTIIYLDLGPDDQVFAKAQTGTVRLQVADTES